MASSLEMGQHDTSYFDVLERHGGRRPNPDGPTPDEQDPDKATYTTDDGSTEEIRLTQSDGRWEWFNKTGEPMGVGGKTREEAYAAARAKLHGFGKSKGNPYQGMFGEANPGHHSGARPGSGPGWFERCEAGVGKEYDPGAVCATMEKKYARGHKRSKWDWKKNPKSFSFRGRSYRYSLKLPAVTPEDDQYADQLVQSIRAKGYAATCVYKEDRAGRQNYILYSDYKPRAKRNPAGAAADLYESFHGAPSTEEVVIEEEYHEHEHLAALGTLTEIYVDTPTRIRVRIDFEKNPPFLASSEDGRQLYIEGGDQSVDLATLKMDEKKWLKDRMVLGVFSEPEPGAKPTNNKRYWNLAYKTKKKFDDFEEIIYQHDLGEDTGERPYLEYEPQNQKLYITGGQYFIKQPLVGVSPGIEN